MGVDGPIIIGILGGLVGTIGAVRSIIDSVAGARKSSASSRTDEARLHLEEKAQETSDTKWFLEEIKAERAALKEQNAELVEKIERKGREHAEQIEKMRTEHERLQQLFRDAIERLESCQMEHPKRSANGS